MKISVRGLCVHISILPNSFPGGAGYGFPGTWYLVRYVQGRFRETEERRELRGKGIWDLFERAAPCSAGEHSAAGALTHIMDGTRGLDLKDQTELKMWTSDGRQWQGWEGRSVGTDMGLDL